MFILGWSTREIQTGVRSGADVSVYTGMEYAKETDRCLELCTNKCT